MRTLLCTALLAASIAAPATAGSLLDLTIVDRDTGVTLPTYTDAGRLYVAGTPGHRYSVRLHNRSGSRVLAVLSVDGVNAVSGQTASPDQTGYVLDPWESTRISGWRKNLDEVAQFNFTALPNSYAARTGRPENVGVIGVAVFTERLPLQRARDEIATQKMQPSQPASAPMEGQSRGGAAKDSADSQARSSERLGTGHGAREFAHVDTTTFTRDSSNPAETLAIWYDSYSNLVEQGVIARPFARANPQPFPGGFVADPPTG